MSTELKIIKTETQYRAYLAEVEQLAAQDPHLGTPEGDRLELLAKLVEDYEVERFKFEKPDPNEAIRFRMEEQGLRRKDLAPLLGGKNRVSEILSGKRPLTLAMVRALTETLRIPAELLIREPESPRYGAEFDTHPISTRFPEKADEVLELDVHTITDTFRRSLGPEIGPLFLKRTITYGATPKTNKTNLWRWVAKVQEIAESTRNERGPWKAEILNEDFLRHVAQMSTATEGPCLARDFLSKKGIALVILPALPRTRLDGAAMPGADGAPVIGLTIRHDRLDNFWFTLLHELAHAWKHLTRPDLAITDENLELREDDDDNEAEANRLAWEAFIPRSQWERSEAFLRPSAKTIPDFAQKLHIHPAVVAGRLRREKSGYRAFNQLIGHHQVRRLFPEVKWS